MPLNVRIIHPDSDLFTGEVEYLLAPGVRATLGIMPGHTPMFAELKKGEIELKKPGNEPAEKVAIEGGILRVRDDTVVILASPKP